MDGPGGRAQGALRRKALKVLPEETQRVHRLQHTRGGHALIGILLRRRRQAYQLPHWRSTLDPHNVNCHKMQIN